MADRRSRNIPARECQGSNLQHDPRADDVHCQHRKKPAFAGFRK
jgi:hypothetical protein